MVGLTAFRELLSPQGHPDLHRLRGGIRERTGSPTRPDVPGAQEYNCFLIHATAPNGGTRDADHISPFPLQAFGHVAVIRSSPADRDDYEGPFTKTDLVKTLDIYRSADPEKNLFGPGPFTDIIETRVWA
ncbi:hypothetical protein N7492_002310 [Penicillium capsulatum]|uniref:Uncharacterized protein n=1 Tax=Penicillium capsulatum TaxID=69766 RepID=A0A9W9IL92_9EURO|nr:hypothetical protein N7492_002310 [Penicillium capsulatum]KAJ6123083.1 hypothetical protein N7512_005548 [Penicillium capsulatum]